MVFALSFLQKTPDELADIARKEPEALVDMLDSLQSWQETFEGYAKIMKVAQLRTMAAACRTEVP